MPAFLKVLAILAMTTMLSACGLYQSDIDLAPLAQRPAKSPIAMGRYCSVERDEMGLLQVKASEDCGLIAWDKASRRLILNDEPPDPESEERIAPRRLSGDLFLLQYESKQKDDDPRYAAVLSFLSAGAAVSLPDLEDEPYRELAARQSAIAFRRSEERPVIVSGALADIDRFLKSAGALAVKLNDQGEEGYSLLVRDDAVADHVATPAQRRTVERLLRQARKLSAQAPDIVLTKTPAE